jgi:hypothetical protein
MHQYHNFGFTTDRLHYFQTLVTLTQCELSTDQKISCAVFHFHDIWHPILHKFPKIYLPQKHKIYIPNSLSQPANVVLTRYKESIIYSHETAEAYELNV